MHNVKHLYKLDARMFYVTVFEKYWKSRRTSTVRMSDLTRRAAFVKHPGCCYESVQFAALLFYSDDRGWTSETACSCDATILQGFWSSAPAHSTFVFFWRFGTNFSVLVSLNHLSLRLSIYSLVVSFGSYSCRVPINNPLNELYVLRCPPPTILFCLFLHT